MLRSFDHPIETCSSPKKVRKDLHLLFGFVGQFTVDRFTPMQVLSTPRVHTTPLTKKENYLTTAVVTMSHAALRASAQRTAPFQANGSSARVTSRLRVIPTFERRHETLSQPLITGQTLVLTLSIFILLSGLVDILGRPGLFGFLPVEDCIPIF